MVDIEVCRSNCLAWKMWFHLCTNLKYLWAFFVRAPITFTETAFSHSLLSLHLTYWALGLSRSCSVDLCMWCPGEPAGLCFGSIFCLSMNTLTEPSFWQLSAWPKLLSFVFRFVTSMLTLCMLHFTRAPSTLRSGECAINYVLSAKNVDYIVTKLASLLVAIVYKKYVVVTFYGDVSKYHLISHLSNRLISQFKMALRRFTSLR